MTTVPRVLGLISLSEYSISSSSILMGSMLSKILTRVNMSLVLKALENASI